MTPLDYYLWCAVKDKCYADKPVTIDALKDNIPEAIAEKQLHTILFYSQSYSKQSAERKSAEKNHLLGDYGSCCKSYLA